MRLWDITEGSLLKTFPVKSPIVSLVRHPPVLFFQAIMCRHCVLSDPGVNTVPSHPLVSQPGVLQVVPAVGLHAFVAMTHAGGDKHGRVLRLNTATGRVEEAVFRTSVARPLSVRPCMPCTPFPFACHSSLSEMNGLSAETGQVWPG